MPHIIIEHTDNIIEQDLQPLFQAMHQVLAEGLPTDIINCKSRSQICSQFLVGDGIANAGFVHVQIRLLSGRSEAVLKTVGDALMPLLSQHFQASSEQLELQISLEINELPVSYFRV